MQFEAILSDLNLQKWDKKQQREHDKWLEA